MDEYRDAAWLRAQYVERGKTQREIADDCDVSPRTIRTWMTEHGIEARDVAGENHGLYGDERDDAVKERISETMRGREFDVETREKLADAKRGTTIPADVRERIGDSLAGREKSAETRKRMSEGRVGEKNHRWKGGFSEHYGSGWSAVRRAVVERDEVCQICGEDGTNERLEAHHIVPVRLFDHADEYEKTDAHFAENAVLLCAPCHRATERGDLPWYAPPDEIPDRIGEV